MKVYPSYAQTFPPTCVAFLLAPQPVVPTGSFISEINFAIIIQSPGRLKVCRPIDSRRRIRSPSRRETSSKLEASGPRGDKVDRAYKRRCWPARAQAYPSLKGSAGFFMVVIFMCFPLCLLLLLLFLPLSLYLFKKRS